MNKFLIVLIFVLAPLASAQVSYTITDLGPLAPAAINSWGQVVGTLNNHAYMWTKFGGLRDLGTLSGGNFSIAAGINDLGVVTGTADGPGTVVDASAPDQSLQCSDLTQPFIWTQRNGMKGLGTVPFAGGSWKDFWCSTPFYALALNARGQVVGFSGNPGTSYQFSFLWTQAAGMTKFGGSWPSSYSSGINNFGQIVGQDTDYTISLANRGAYWKNGVITYLTPLDAGDPNALWTNSAAIGVNDLGQIVGWSETAPFASDFHAVSWTTSGSVHDLGTLPGDSLSVASKVNFFGQIIGSSGNSAFVQFPSDGGPTGVVGRPFVWTKRKGIQDLNALIPANSGWVLKTATDINVWGQIVGTGTRNGHSHGYLLTPRTLVGF